MSETEQHSGLDVEIRDEQLKLSFDQYQRYRIVTDAMEKLRENDTPLEILDAGGGDGIILNFLPGDRITILDQTEPEHEVPGFVQGDATAMPFEDGAYDYVVSVDVYEHIPPQLRSKYLSELRRTARKGVLLAAPFNTEAARDAERTANEFHRSVHLAGNVWLEEHAENGLPELEEARGFFEGYEDAVSIVPNGYIPHWLAMICLTFYSPKLEGGPDGIFERVNAFYNRYMYEQDNVEPCYRYMVAALKEPAEADLDTLASPETKPSRPAHSSTLFGTLSAMLLLSNETKRQHDSTARYERRLAEREAALARRNAQIKDLSYRLAGLVSAANARQSQVEQRLAVLQQGQNKAERRRAELEEQNANLIRQRDRFQRQVQEITGSRTWRLLSVQSRVRNRIGRLFGSGRG